MSEQTAPFVVTRSSLRQPPSDKGGEEGVVAEFNENVSDGTGVFGCMFVASRMIALSAEHNLPVSASL